MQMRSHTGCRRQCAVFSAIALLALSETVIGQGQGGRTISFKPGVPIVSQLDRNDIFVTVDRIWEGVAFSNLVRLSPKDQIGTAVARAEAAVILRVESVEPRLTEDESWIQTELIGRVNEVLVSETPRLSKGRLISLNHESGGEAVLSGIRIRAGVPLILREGASCLVFMVRGDARPWVPIHPVLTIENGMLVDASKAQGSRATADPLDGMSLSQAKRLIREAAAEVQAERRNYRRP